MYTRNFGCRKRLAPGRKKRPTQHSRRADGRLRRGDLETPRSSGRCKRVGAQRWDILDDGDLRLNCMLLKEPKDGPRRIVLYSTAREIAIQKNQCEM